MGRHALLELPPRPGVSAAAPILSVTVARLNGRFLVAPGDAAAAAFLLLLSALRVANGVGPRQAGERYAAPSTARCNEEVQTLPGVNVAPPVGAPIVRLGPLHPRPVRRPLAKTRRVAPRQLLQRTADVMRPSHAAASGPRPPSVRGVKVSRAANASPTIEPNEDAYAPVPKRGPT